jgi:rRNA maturation RNase YbeY
MAQVSIRNLTRTPSPRFPYEKVAAHVLAGWDISLVFIGPAKARALNESLRGKTYTPNVLSYEVGAKHGEIFICLSEAAKQAPDYELSPRLFVLYLFIHGLLHLKGRAHGATMEKCERDLLALFAKSVVRSSHNATQNRNGNRHRHLPSKTGGRRRAR